MRYVEVRGDRVEVRESARDHFVRGALLTFGVPWLVAGLGWVGFAILAEPDATLALAITAIAIGFGCVIPALGGLFTMATAARRAARSRIVIDLGERLIERASGPAEVYRKPSAVRLARRGLGGWSLTLEGDAPTTLVRRVPHGSGRALAEAADALAEALGVAARVPTAARRAVGLLPHDEDVWAALCYAPLDGVNMAYSLLALRTSTHPRLRFAAKQSLVLFVVEAFLAATLGTCLVVPLAIVAAPVAVEVAAFLCPFAILTAIRVAIRGTAAYRAYRREAWVMPWLAPVVRRWAPADAQSPTARAPIRDQPGAQRRA